MSVADVQAAIIEPMLDYPPPRRLLDRPGGVERALVPYRRALARFSRFVLEQAWQKTLEENKVWCWPTVEALLSNAVAIHQRTQAREQDTWVEQATRLADQYTRRFMKTHQAAVRAREGGYERELRTYVQEAAWVQAQYLLGRTGVAFTSAVLFPEGEDRNARAEWFEKAGTQAEKGSIKVNVPSKLVERWKQQAENRGRTR
jgi:hypothetical protein